VEEVEEEEEEEEEAAVVVAVVVGGGGVETDAVAITLFSSESRRVRDS
jgi:hypothetical protein